MMQDVHVKLNSGWPWQKQHSTRRRRLGSWESRSEIPGKFWNVVLVKDGEDQLGQSCGKLRSITESQWAKEYPTNNKRRNANWIGHVLRRNCLLKHVIEGKIEGRIEVTGRCGKRLKQLLDELKDKIGYWKWKKEALDPIMWRTRFGISYRPIVRQTTEWMIAQYAVVIPFCFVLSFLTVTLRTAGSEFA